MMKLLLALFGVAGTTLGLHVPPENADQERETSGGTGNSNTMCTLTRDNSGWYEGAEAERYRKNKVMSASLIGNSAFAHNKGAGIGMKLDNFAKTFAPNGAEKGPYHMSDANHPGHKRFLKWIGDEADDNGYGYKLRVTGDDGKDTPEWTVEGLYDDVTGLVSLDFSAQKGPKELVAGFGQNSLKFENGMEWMMTHPDAFEGDYSDPNHPGCPRNLKVEGGRVIFTGADQTEGATECGEGTTGPSFEITGTLVGNEIRMDFSPKGGPKLLIGQATQNVPGASIVWLPPHNNNED